MQATLTVAGDRELMAKFAALSTRIQNRSLGRALKAGGKPVQAQAKSNIRRDTGAAARSITLKKAKQKKRGITTYVVFAKPSKLGLRKNTLKDRKGGDKGYSGYYPAYLEHKHGGRHKWLGPAFQSRQSQSRQIIANVLRSEIEAAARGAT